jgi:hypothetical protein
MAVRIQVLARLRFQGGFEHRLGQARPGRRDHPVGAGCVHELLGELLLINLIRHDLDRLGRDWSFPPSCARRVGPEGAPTSPGELTGICAVQDLA